jgi:hypothetical protein
LSKPLIMETITYQLTIKKEYASAILEELMLNEAIEYKPNNIPEWQIIESRKRLAEMKANPSSSISADDFFDSIVDD